MQSLNRRVPRVMPVTRVLTLALTLAVVGGVGACADDAAPIATTTTPGNPPRTAAPPTSATAPDSGALAWPTVDVAGLIVDDGDVPVVGRNITIVDRRGRHEEILSDEDGGFHIQAVAPPYDLLVAAAPSGAVITPLVYLGLNRADPRIEVSEAPGPVTRPQGQPIRVGVKLPPCPRWTGACWVTVVTHSANGHGMTAGSYTEGLESAVYDVTHSWEQEQTQPDEMIDVHILVGDAQYTHYAYAQFVHVEARPGELTDLGMTTPVPIESSPPVTVSERGVAQAEGWQFTLASQLLLSDGATIALRYDWAASSALRLPLLPGAGWQVAGWTQNAPNPDDPSFHLSMQAWSGTLPLSTANVAFDLPTPPAPLRPTMAGDFSRRGAGFAWDGTHPGLAELVVVDATHGGEKLHAFTADAEVSLKRLDALGLARLRQGEHTMDLTTTPGMTADELTEPDAPKRRERFDVDSPGAITYQRFRFVVTP